MDTNEDKFRRIVEQALRSMKNVKAPKREYEAALQMGVREFRNALDRSVRSPHEVG